MKQKLLSFLVLCSIFIGSALAQNRTVTGRVTSAGDGLPLSGVTVFIEGTNSATQTDDEGNYSISAAQNNRLIFSYMGYVTQRLSVGSQTLINVVLSGEDESIDEVVVTALGIRREKRALGYATQEVKGESITQAANSNLATSLQGKVAGVEVTPSSGMPGASAKLTIRGSRSFTGNNQPLYVVDGLPISSAPDISTGNSVTGADYSARGLDIDPNDIESVNVLKGQAASALYGMRASNGVIVITTKSGRGASKGKAQISYNTNVSFDKVSVLPDFQTEFAQGAGGAFNPNSSLSWGQRISDLNNDPNYGGDTDNDFTAQFGRRPGQYYVPQRAAAGLDPWATPMSYSNTKDFFNTGNNFNNSLNVVQGFDKGSYAFTLGATNVNGIVPSTGLDRYNAKLAANLDISDNWKTGFVGNFMTSKLSKQSGANNGIVATLYGAPASYDLRGIPSFVAGDPFRQNTYRSTAGFDGVYWAVDNNEFTEDTDRFFGNTFIQYSNQLSERQNLVLKYQLGADSYTTKYTDLFGYGHANQRGEISNFTNSILEINSLATAAYNLEINDDWTFDALLGNEIVHRNRRYDFAYGAVFNFPGFNSINNASVFEATQTLRQTRTVGTFGSLSLAYKNMWFLNATGRNDVVSSMPRNNRSFFYPSVATSFIFTELDGLRNDVLTYGKLRASYAEVGQAGDYYESYYDKPAYGGGFSGGVPILYPLGDIVSYTQYPILYDPALRPQNTLAYEIGADLGFYNGLVTLDYTFSRQNVKDQIFEVPLAGSSGFSSLMTNGGQIRTNVHEVSLNVAPYRQGDFKWDFTFNFSKIDNYVQELAEGVESIFLGGFVDPQIRAGIGYRFPVIYGVSYLRNDQGQIVVDADGLPQAGSEAVLGTVAPDFILGFNTRLEYKKIRLAAVLDWKQGGQMYHGTSNTLDFYGVTQKTADFRSGAPFLFEQPAVKENGEANDILIDPSDAQAYFDRLSTISEAGVRGTSFVKLREISLGYPIYKSSAFSIDANVFARNIILWSELKGYDPEVSQGNTNMSGGFERFSLPGTSNYGFGLNLKF